MTEKAMPDPDLALDTPLWRFALCVWQQPEVERLCLRLQEEGWSVTCILCASWLAARGSRFSGEPEAIRRWRRDVTAPLRQIRKRLPKNREALAHLRKSVGRAELDAEQIELALAYEALTKKLEPATHSDFRQLLTDNLRQASPQQEASPEQIDRGSAILAEALLQCYEEVSPC